MERAEVRKAAANLSTLNSDFLRQSANARNTAGGRAQTSLPLP